MYDRQSGSLWAQALGVAIGGKFKGNRLEMYPASMMTWKQWRMLHPDTLVLTKQAGRAQAGSAYQEYHESSRIGVTGRLRFTDRQVPAKARMIGFRIGDHAYAAELSRLRSARLLLAESESGPLAVVGSPEGIAAKAFMTGGRQLEFLRAERGRFILIDRKTGLEFDGGDGSAVSDPGKKAKLEEIPSYLSYWFAWKAFFPATRVLKP